MISVILKVQRFLEGETRMDNYITGMTIRMLRERRNYTQKELGDMLGVSDKTVSKWENGRGYPDIGILESLANTLGVNIAELITGNVIQNKNRSSNMKKISFYVCPMCGNIVHSVGEVLVSCCGIELPVLEIEEDILEHKIKVERIDNEFYITINHEMSKEHYISFISYVMDDRIETKKLYPEENAEVRFARKGKGYLYFYCNRHGLFRIQI